MKLKKFQDALKKHPWLAIGIFSFIKNQKIDDWDQAKNQKILDDWAVTNIRDIRDLKFYAELLDEGNITRDQEFGYLWLGPGAKDPQQKIYSFLNVVCRAVCHTPKNPTLHGIENDHLDLEMSSFGNVISYRPKHAIGNWLKPIVDQGWVVDYIVRYAITGTYGLTSTMLIDIFPFPPKFDLSKLGHCGRHRSQYNTTIETVM